MEPEGAQSVNDADMVKKPRSRTHQRRGPLSYYNEIGEPETNFEDADAIKREVGRRIHQLLIERGWNQSELARRANEYLPKPAPGQKQGHEIGRDAVSNYIRGEHLPRSTYLSAIAKAFGVLVSDIMPASVPSVSNRQDKSSSTLSIQDVPGEPGVQDVKFHRKLSTAKVARFLQMLSEPDNGGKNGESK